MRLDDYRGGDYKSSRGDYGGRDDRRRSSDFRDRRGGDRRYDDGDRRSFRKNDGRDRPPPSSTLGIFGMSLNTKENDLYSIFEKYGRVENVKIINDRDSGKSRGFGFVTFEKQSAAADARDGVSDQVIDGMKVRVDYALGRSGGGGGGGGNRRSSPPRRRSPARRSSPRRGRSPRTPPSRDRSPVRERSYSR